MVESVLCDTFHHYQVKFDLLFIITNSYDIFMQQFLQLAEWETSKKTRSLRKNLDDIGLLEDLTSTRTWYLDLRTMAFTEISEKIFEFYGISKENSKSYGQFFVRLRIAG